MEQFSDASSYCQHIKSLSDQLSNVGAPVSNERMVLQLIYGLSDAYATVGSQIRHSEILPPFYKARSMVVLEETAMAKRTQNNIDNSAFISSQEKNSLNSPLARASRNQQITTSSRGGRSSSSNYRGGRTRGRGRGGRSHYHQNRTWNQSWAYPPWVSQWQPWATPPCPYHTIGNWQQSVAPNRQPGILRQRPQQAHMASTQPSYTPTDIQAAMQTLYMAPPNEQWYMDTGATSHMTAN
ncbi:uncharacterized protein [Medicago truncatula]|uniref:uncharacterized protein n=1 Tax=Medicago truncatula TaxID=3880 RepID=UPI000D2F16A6|nr:uncharacterized protein LOC112420985 [Medicago truncatula]